MRLDGSRDESEAEVGQGRFFRRWEEKRFSKGRTAERAARSTTSRHFRLRELVSRNPSNTNRTITNINTTDRTSWVPLRPDIMVKPPDCMDYFELDTMEFVALYCMPHFPESRSGCYLTNEHVEGWLSRERYSFRDCSRSIVSRNV